ncbi:MBL fold metallo-hydrolase [Paenibacillus sp. SI8]|uniref:MBL fold metallo-hydrolase n=1 Tax=unclassified Paenibacillus TaxID=185978 RepID=UPI0034664DC1
MRIAEGIALLEISVPVMGGIDVIHPTLLWDAETAILVDTGYPGILPKLREAFELEGVPYNRLSKIIITHQDMDHIGSLPAILSESSHPIEVLANAIEKPYIEGDNMLLKITPETIDQAVASLPSHVSPDWRAAFRKTLENPPKSPVDRIVEDGEELPEAGGIVIINTPGHTPGHISLYHRPSKTLIAADALVVKEGQLFGPTPEYAIEYEKALTSVKVFAQFDIETVICYHGGLFTNHANRRIAEIVSTI